MKRGSLAGAALAALTSAALAADLRTPVKAPPIVAAPVSAAYDWTGFYIGGNYGTVIAQWRAHTSATKDHLGDVELNDAGLTAGAQAGYNWQFNPNWLAGLEGDIGYFRASRSFKDWNDDTIVGVKATWYGTMRVRAGYVLGPSLLYATGGAAFVDIHDTFGGNPATDTRVKSGWAAGGGIETKLSRNWSTTTEYLYVDAGSTTFASNPFGTLTVDHRFHVLKSGLNYRFGGGPSEGLPFLPFSNTPLLTPAHNWAGFYVGGNAGLGISVVRAIATPATSGDATGETDVNGTGFTGGAQAGYNFMIIPKWFVGVEGDINYLGIIHSFVEWDDIDTFALKTDWYSTLRGRVGSTTGPAFLYLTGGAAFVHVRDTLTQGTLGTSVSKTASGWTFGGGVETALDAHWSARLESLYIDVGSEHASALNGISTEFKNRFQVIRAGLDYTFGGSELLPFR